MFRQTFRAILLKASKATAKSRRREAQPQSRKIGFMRSLRRCLSDLRAFAVVFVVPLLGASHALAQPAATTTTTSPGPINLIRNGGFEEPGGKLAMHWEPLVIGAPADIALDTTEKHGGNASVRVSAKEITRSYAHGAALQVSPGETLNVSAWVKLRGVPSGPGRARIIAEFSRGRDTKEAFLPAGEAEPGAGGWQRIGDTIKIPADASVLRLRVGLAYSSGTTWWDDVSVTSQRPVISRIALPGPRVSPAMDALPVEILNRDGSKGPITIRATLGKQKGEAKVELTG